MKVFLVTPAAPGSLSGNRVTAERWARLSRELGHEVEIAERWDGEHCDVLVALHARRSAGSVERVAEERPEIPRVVVLTGTDLYGDLPSGDARALDSLRRAHLLVGLHRRAADALPVEIREEMRPKVRVIYQSVEPTERPRPSAKPADDGFRVCLLAHVRPVKDPLLAPRAAAFLPDDSEIEIVHAGEELDPAVGRELRAAAERSSRYRWVGPLPRAEAMELLSGSRLLLVTSKMEGGANVVSEAVAHGVPVLSTEIDGTAGLLGEDYPGLFPVGDARALADRLRRAETDPEYLDLLAERCRARRHLLSPERERSAWSALLAEAVG